ncbi:hypothetical protein A2U01_0071426 [Trifolium medium]|uniref:Uncharacterized protein n=1 Tax=Trifolium medium TaxID=97028 RepID=A0A392SP40_9FABA|nr:hypothetical protein [Trifolium medium]
MHFTPPSTWTALYHGDRQRTEEYVVVGDAAEEYTTVGDATARYTAVPTERRMVDDATTRFAAVGNEGNCRYRG